MDVRRVVDLAEGIDHALHERGLARAGQTDGDDVAHLGQVRPEGQIALMGDVH